MFYSVAPLLGEATCRTHAFGYVIRRGKDIAMELPGKFTLHRFSPCRPFGVVMREPYEHVEATGEPSGSTDDEAGSSVYAAGQVTRVVGANHPKHQCYQ